jgi:hypothetical protein
VIFVQVGPEDRSVLLELDRLEMLSGIDERDVVLKTIDGVQLQSDFLVPADITHAVHVDKFGKFGLNEGGILDIYEAIGNLAIVS